MARGGPALGVVYSDEVFNSLAVTTLAVSGNGTVTGNYAVSGNMTISGNAAVGDASTDIIGFYGATQTTQPATFAAVTTATLTSVTTTAATSTTPYGFATSTQADAIVALVNALAVRGAALTVEGNAARTSLIALGLVAAA